MIHTQFNFTEINKYKKIIHCHIFKSAGSYFDFHIKNLGNYYEFNADDDLQIRKKNFSLIEIKNNYILSSHAVPLLSELYKDYLWFIIIRDPIERIKSAFIFEKFHQPYGQTPGSTKSKDLCINKFFEWRLNSTNHAYVNVYIRTILHITNDKLDETSVSQALQKLEADNIIYCDIKDVEKMIVQILFTNDINMKNTTTKINQSKNSQEKNEIFEKLDKNLYSELIKKNSHDLQLYNLLFNQHIKNVI